MRITLSSAGSKPSTKNRLNSSISQPSLDFILCSYACRKFRKVQILDLFGRVWSDLLGTLRFSCLFGLLLVTMSLLEPYFAWTICRSRMHGLYDTQQSSSAHEGSITAVRATADGLHWITAGTDSRVRLWDSSSFRLAADLLCFSQSLLLAFIAIDCNSVRTVLPQDYKLVHPL